MTCAARTPSSVAIRCSIEGSMAEFWDGVMQECREGANYAETGRKTQAAGSIKGG
jgi:hypothetical protein